MKVCIIISQQNTIFIDSLIEAGLEHEIEIIPFIVKSYVDYGKQRKELIRLLKDCHIPYILSFNDFYNGSEYLLTDEIFDMVSHINLWYVDAMRVDIPDNSCYGRYNRIFSFEIQDIESCRNKYNREVMYLPFTAGKGIFCTQPREDNEDFDYDICFVGLVAGNQYRLDILNAVAELCRGKGYSCILYGHFWHDTHAYQRVLGGLKFKMRYPGLYPFVHNHFLSPQEVSDLYRKSKICLNIHTPAHSGLNCRSFEIMGNDNFLLSDKKDTSALEISENVHYAVYENPDMLVNRISYYLEHEDERHRIARAGGELVRNLYTMDKVLLKALDFTD